MPKNELPADGDWAAVHAAVRRRMKRLDLSVARLSRASGVSETTLRYIRRPVKRQRSTLVALSAALGFRPGYLEEVLRGQAHDDGSAAIAPCTAGDKLDDILQLLRGIAAHLESGPARPE